MRGMMFLFVFALLWSRGVTAWQTDALPANSVNRFVALTGSTSGEDFICLNGEPFVLVGVCPTDGKHRVELCSKEGHVVWAHELGEGEQLGQARLSPDGKYLVYDYFVVDPSKKWLAPHERVSYRGGIRGVRRDGSIAWERPSRGVSEGGPTSSPEGTVEQVAGNKVLILRYGWECIQQVTVRDLAGQRLLSVDTRTPTSSATAATLFEDGSHLVISQQAGDPDKVWTRVMRLDGRTVGRLAGAHLPDEGIPRWLPLPGSYLLLEVSSWQQFATSLGHERRPAPMHATRAKGEPDKPLVLVTCEGKLVWTGRWRFDAEADPTPTLQDEGKDVSWGAANWDENRQMLAQRGSQVTVLWNRGSRRRLLTLEAPEQGRGALVLQRVVALPAARAHEMSTLSSDGRLVAIYRVSRDGNAGMLHAHFWDQRGRFLGEASVRGLPLSESGLPGYPEKVWTTPDNRYVVVWLRFGARESSGYCVLRVPGESQP